MGACYLLQMLFEKPACCAERPANSSPGRNNCARPGVAAEIAHQIKNPLGIINNVFPALQRAFRGKPIPLNQLQIIREEVDRSDRIITELMATQLAEARSNA